MNTPHEHLDIALQRLLDGESVEALSREFPGLASELAAHATVLQDLSKAASMRPSEEGLRRALSSMRAMDAAREMAAPAPSYMRISSFFMTYRTALVLPVLVIMLVATGAVVLPLSMDEGSAPLQENDITLPAAAPDAERTSFSARSAEPQSDAGAAQSAPMMLKSAQMAAPEEPMPENQDLASVFGSEMRNDTQDAMAAQSAAAEEADDSQDVSGYDTAYDANDL